MEPSTNLREFRMFGEFGRRENIDIPKPHSKLNFLSALPNNIDAALNSVRFCIFITCACSAMPHQYVKRHGFNYILTMRFSTLAGTTLALPQVTLKKIGFPGWPDPNLDSVSGFWGVN
jgi:hypothetical protein